MDSNFKKNLMEESIAAFLVIPCPQNMLISKPLKNCPTDDVIFSLRLLEALGQAVVLNAGTFTSGISFISLILFFIIITALGIFFTSLSSNEQMANSYLGKEGFTQVLKPNGKIPTKDQLMKWVHPAFRLLAVMKKKKR
jgi:hypothetical protein